jgi:CheY-like chemotaxis protein
MDVLLVEDESMVREVVSEFLHDAGLEVTEVSSAASALEVLEADHGAPPPPVLVTDVNLGEGGMDGIALAEELRRRWPAIGIVVITGHAPNLVRMTLLQPHARSFLKPFPASELVRAVQDLVAPEVASPR